MKQDKWFNRSFNFNTKENIFPSIIERLMGTPARLEEKFRMIPASILHIRLDGAWSVKENAGHLIDLEPLWQGRLHDILEGKTELRPTDLQNTKTTEAGHNDIPVGDLLQKFRSVRKSTIEMIQDLDEEQILKSALHPRLKTPMRTMDHFLFVAEHDDHHLARITALVKYLS